MEKKNEECESLKQHLTKAMYQGKSFALMPSIDDDHHVESPFLTPKPKVMVGISCQGGLCCDHHVESPFLTPKPKVLVGISCQGGLCCDHHVESPFLTPKPKVLVGRSCQGGLCWYKHILLV